MSEIRHALKQRKDDLYETPPEATLALIKHEYIPRRVWEPACGRGAISNVLVEYGGEVLSTDLIDYGWGHVHGCDFLMERHNSGFDCIVTNPPFKLATEFARHAIDLCPKVVMLLRLAFLESDKTRNDLLDAGRLARVHVFRNRLPMMHRDGWEGKKSTSTTAYAWFVWDRGHIGPAILNRISWERIK